jgi:hypothetical protein
MYLKFKHTQKETPEVAEFWGHLERQNKKGFVTGRIAPIAGPLRRSVYRSGYYLSFLLKLLTV